MKQFIFATALLIFSGLGFAKSSQSAVDGSSGKVLRIQVTNINKGGPRRVRASSQVVLPATPVGSSLHFIVEYFMGPSVPSSVGATTLDLTDVDPSVVGWMTLEKNTCGNRSFPAFSPGSYVKCEISGVFSPTLLKSGNARLGEIQVAMSYPDISSPETFDVLFGSVGYGSPEPTKTQIIGKTISRGIFRSESGSVSEEIPLVGTEFGLVYNSEYSRAYLAKRAAGTTSSFGYEGLNLSVQHFYDSATSYLFMGTGEIAYSPSTSASGGTLKVVSPDGSETYTFTAEGRHISTHYGLTGATKYLFDYASFRNRESGTIISHHDMLTSVTNAFGGVLTINRGTFGELASIVAPKGQATLIELEEDVSSEVNLYKLRRIKKVTLPSGGVYELEFNELGQLLRLIDPNSDEFNFEYSPYGRCYGEYRQKNFFEYTPISEDAGTIHSHVLFDSLTSINRTSTGVSKQTTFQDGRVVNYSENADQSFVQTSGNSSLVALTVDDERFGSARKRIYSCANTVAGKSVVVNASKSVTGAGGNFSSVSTHSINGVNAGSVSFSSSSGKFLASSNEGAKHERSINAYEQPVGEKIGDDVPWSFVYDGSGRVASLKQGTHNAISLTYNGEGNVQSVTNARNETTTYAYNANGQVTQKTLPNLGVIRFQYDSRGNLTGLTPPGKPEHGFTYHLIGLLKEYSPPSGSATQYQYMGNGNEFGLLTKVTRPDGQEATFGYTSAQNLAYASGATYGYEAGSDLLLTSSYQVLSNYTYNVYDLETEEQRRIANNFLYAKLAYEYDSAHRIVSRTLHGNSSTPSSVIPISYNNDQVPVSVGSLEMAYSYPSGRLSTTKLGRISDVRTYDQYGLLSSYTASYSPLTPPLPNIKAAPQVIFCYTLTRDVMGRIVSKTESVLGVTDIYFYSYDRIGRLTKVTKNAAVYSSYNYDSNGNKISGIAAGVPFTASYDNEDRILTYNSKVFTHNANGDIVKMEANVAETTTYSFDRAVGLQRIVRPNGDVVENNFDGKFRRIGVFINGVTDVRYIYQDDLRIAAHFGNSGVISKEYVYGTGDTAPDYMIRNGINYRIIKDHLGSPRLVVNSDDGTIAQHMDYTDQGVITTNTSPSFQHYGFAGGINDSSSRLVKGFVPMTVRV